jgi:hypothetical protein
MKIKLFFLLTLVLIFTTPGYTQPGAKPAWNPKKTWVFFAGLLEWKDKASFSSFPQTNRRDAVLLDQLRKSGVPESQIVYLKDSQATTANIKAKLTELLSQAKPDDWAFVYYCGHGYKTDDEAEAYLASYDTAGKNLGWSVDSIPDTIDASFKGSHAIIALDNCYSGSIMDAVSAKKRPVSYAVFASSSASEMSTGNWTFTEALISAFRGASYMDDNGDTSVTLAELGANAREDMLFGEEQLATIAFTGGFDPETVIARSSVAAGPRVGERVESYSIDGWYKGFITDANKGKFKVHYFGYEDAEDEWVVPKMIRQAKTVQYAVGQKIQVIWQKKWYAAKVLQVEGGVHYVTYDGYGSEWNEWVPSARIRKTK